MAIGRLVFAGVTVALLGCAGSSGVLAATAKKHAATRTQTARVERAEPHRARTRIQIYGSRAPLHRDCRAVFDERWIPEWGGRVLYAGQDCWWTRE